MTSCKLELVSLEDRSVPAVLATAAVPSPPAEAAAVAAAPASPVPASAIAAATSQGTPLGKLAANHNQTLVSGRRRRKAGRG